MKSTTVFDSQVTNPIIFPCLGRALQNDMVVLFTSNTTGTVVSPGTSGNNIGYHNSNWGSLILSGTWVILRPQEHITLENT